jgi:hypothetical protein
MIPTVDTRTDQAANLTPVEGFTFVKPLAIVVERRSTSGGRPCYVVGVTSGVRTVERFLHTHRPVWTVRTARRKAADLQHDLDRGYINPTKALCGPSSRRATVEDLTGFVPAPKRSEMGGRQ